VKIQKDLQMHAKWPPELMFLLAVSTRNK